MDSRHLIKRSGKIDNTILSTPVNGTLIARNEIQADELKKRCIARGRTDLKVQVVDYDADLSGVAFNSVVVDDFYSMLAEELGCSRVQAKSRCLTDRYMEEHPDPDAEAEANDEFDCIGEPPGLS